MLALFLVLVSLPICLDSSSAQEEPELEAPWEDLGIGPAVSRERTWRMEVPGGWIYAVSGHDGKAMTFVPRPEKD